MNSAYLMGGIIAQIFSLSTLLAIFLGIVLKSRPIVNILCVLTSLIEVGIVSVLNNGTSGGHIYISSIIFSLIIGNLVLSSRRLSSNKKKSKRKKRNELSISASRGLNKHNVRVVLDFN